jgi:hypothetical protein
LFGGFDDPLRSFAGIQDGGFDDPLRSIAGIQESW